MRDHVKVGTPRAVTAGLVGSAVMFSFRRSIEGIDWILPVLGASWLSLVLTLGLRRLGLWAATACIAACVAGVWFITLVLFPETAFLGLPTPESLTLIKDVALATLDRLVKVSPPVRVDAGYLTLLIGGAWVSSSICASTIGHRRYYAGLLPWLATFGISAAVGSEQGRRFHLIIFLTCVIMFLLADSWSEVVGQRWVGAFGRLAPAQRANPVLPRLETALKMGAVALTAAVALPVFIPGYGDPGMVPLKQPGRSSRVEVSPFVQILPRLTSKVERVMFTVTSSRPSYWRLTSLNTFNGQTWELRGNFSRSSQPIALERPPIGETVRVRQRFAVQALGGGWVPAAYAPVRVSGLQDPLVDPVRDTILVDKLRDGQEYEVLSAIPQPDVGLLRSAPAARGTFAREFVRLPAALDPRIREIAESITSAATNDYDRAIAIQDHLRTFEYEENIAAGHSADYLLRFLTEIKAGYCEQFAGSMAVLLRTLGIPSRVAVGFLPGDPGEPSSGGVREYTVTTRDAHAWTEAYFEGAGWMAFEPTPRRGVNESPFGEEAAPFTADSESRSTGETGTQPTPEPAPEASPVPVGRRDPVTVVADIARRASRRVAAAALAVLVLAAASRHTALRLRLGAARRPERRAISVYFDVVDRAADFAQARRPQETESQFFKRALNEAGLDPRDYKAALSVYLRAVYSGEAPGKQDVALAEAAAKAFRKDLLRTARWVGWIKLAFSPRPAFLRLHRVQRALALVSIRASSAARSV